MRVWALAFVFAGVGLCQNNYRLQFRSKKTQYVYCSGVGGAHGLVVTFPKKRFLRSPKCKLSDLQPHVAAKYAKEGEFVIGMCNTDGVLDVRTKSQNVVKQPDQPQSVFDKLGHFVKGEDKPQAQQPEVDVFIPASKKHEARWLDVALFRGITAVKSKRLIKLSPNECV
mmetsp:Transcript_2028/g.2480  ORF Transcript_2028/g.2480 Transcript_2028/m.2480 type:complete len:169 (-) Transcript_2028:127-633(-)